MPKLAIIGDGYSAAVLVYHLIKSKFNPRDITVFGPNVLGLGQAYGSQHDHYRLNVRDNLMRIDPDAPDDFTQWAKANIDDPDAHVEAGAFFKRRDFARYITSTIAAITQPTPIKQIKETVNSISRQHHWRLATDSAEYDAEIMVVATGNPASVLNFNGDDAAAPFITRQPWRGDWDKRISPQDDLVIIGGGLTAMDILSSLAASQHQGHVRVVTPQGVLPPPQLNWQDHATHGFEWPEVNTAAELTHIMKTVMANNGDGQGWLNRHGQEQFERLRKGISPVWRHLPEAEQLRLKRHLGWLWQLLRYRAAPQTVSAQEQMTAKGQLSIIKDRVMAVDALSPSEHGHPLRVRLKKGSDLAAHHVFVATGAGHDPLLAQMASTGLLALKQGHAVVDDSLHLMAPDGTAYHDGFALGPPTVMSRGDVIGATTIAGEALLIAEQITTNNRLSGV